MTVQVLRVLTLMASVLSKNLINSVTEGFVKYLQSLGCDAMIVVKKSALDKIYELSNRTLCTL